MASSRSAGRRGILAALALCAVGAGETRADEPLTNPMLGDPAAIEAGRKTYRQRCYICHLSEGGRGPNLFKTTISDETFLMTVIKTGCTHLGLPNWVQEVVTGGIIVTAVAIDRFRHKRR